MNPRPPVVVQWWLIGWFKLITLPRSRILRKLGMDGGLRGGDSHPCWAVPERWAERFHQASHVWWEEPKGCFVTRDWGTTCLCVLGSQRRWLCDKEIDADVWRGIDRWRSSDPPGDVFLSPYHLTWNKRYLVFWGLCKMKRFVSWWLPFYSHVRTVFGIRRWQGQGQPYYELVNVKALGSSWISLTRHRSRHSLIVLQFPVALESV